MGKGMVHSRAATGMGSLFALHKVTQGITNTKMSVYRVAPPCDRLTHEEMAEVRIIVGTQFLSVLFIAECSGLQGQTGFPVSK